MIIRFILFFLLVFLFGANQGFAQKEKSQELFSKYSDAIFQIRVIDKETKEKYTIGSGFSFWGGTYIGTNYHVISSAIERPGEFTIEYRHEDGRKGTLTPLRVDVIHDLAVLRPDVPQSNYLILGTSRLAKGQQIYSIGNPLDLGMSVVTGNYNGLLEESFYTSILFSGDLNPGMSGGPALDKNGQVIGVNVSIESIGLGHLVPVEFLNELAQAAGQQKGTHKSRKEWNGFIEGQLIDTQDKILDDLVQRDWKTGRIKSLSFPKEIHKAFKCWGESKKEGKKRAREHSQVSCRTEDQIFIQDGFYAGKIFYEVFFLQSDSLSNTSFYNMYSDYYGYISEGFSSTKSKYVKEFECHSDFVKIGGRIWKTVLCMRPYDDMPKVFDVVFSAALIGEDRQGYIVQIVLNGASQEGSTSFLNKFLGTVQWNG